MRKKRHTVYAFLVLLGFLLSPFRMFCANADASENSPKIVALTFDDGPHPSHTNMILDILEEKGVKATFFVIGQNAELYPAPLRRAFAEGHEIENHSYDHKTKGKSTPSLKDSIEATSDVVEKLTGYRPCYFRPPGGFATDSVKTATLDLALKQVFWTIDSLDWTGKEASSIAKQVLGAADGCEVILFHDYMCPKHQVMAALPVIIDGLRERGYRFVTIEEYFGYIDRK